MKVQQGFSLIELSLVILLLSILLTIFFSTVSTIISVGQEKSTIKANQECLNALTKMGLLIEQTYFVKSNSQLLFVGFNQENSNENGDRLIFQTYQSYAEQRKTSAVREISVSYKPDTQNFEPSLILREDSLVDDEPNAGGIEYSLVNGVKEFSILYSTNGTDWRDEWDSRNNQGLPSMLKLSLSLFQNQKIEKCNTLIFVGVERK